MRADRLLIEQAALNLVRNAVEAVQDLEPERRREAAWVEQRFAAPPRVIRIEME